MATTATSDTQVEIVKPVLLGPVNQALIALSGLLGLAFVVCVILLICKEYRRSVKALSGLLGLAFVVGVILLICKEYRRSVNVKVMNFKQKLNTRRKGVSGSSAVRRGTSCDSFAMSEVTSYIQLTETPTSIRCSSAWTPSPVARASLSDTPTSGNFS